MGEFVTEILSTICVNKNI